MKALGKGSVASLVRGALVVAWWFLWFCAVALVCVAIAYACVMIFKPAWLEGQHGHLTFGGHGGASLNVTFDDAGSWLWPVFVPGLMIGGVAIAGALMIVWRLRKLFDSFSSGEPFRRENANHLRAIWIIMLVIELSRYVLLGITGLLITMFGRTNVDADYTFSVDLSTWGAILILIVLAEVFREGASPRSPRAVAARWTGEPSKLLRQPRARPRRRFGDRPGQSDRGARAAGVGCQRS